MHDLQTCLFKYITVAAFHIYVQCGEDAAEKSWNCVFEFLWESCYTVWSVPLPLVAFSLYDG